MKKIQFIISLFVLVSLAACTENSNDVDLNTLTAATKISALATIKQDNSGKVTITPRAEGAVQYEVYFGSDSTPVYLNVGQSTTHIFGEGTWPVKIVAIALNGERTEVTQNVEVSFIAPTELKVKVAPVATDSYSINISATAKFETFFKVYFGDVPNEVPVEFMEGEVVPHKYATTGTYEVRVVAVSGGVASIEKTETVVITVPLALPLTFEGVTPTFGDFGKASSAVVVNPQTDLVNKSATVGKFTKPAGAEVWAGTTITLVKPIDFSGTKLLKMKVWSPKAGIKVLMKLQTLTATPDDITNIEVLATSTVTNAWQELTFDFSAVKTANSYVKVVLFFDFGVAGDGSVYYFDDIKLDEIPPVALPLTFEIPTKISGDFGGAKTVSVANPHIDTNNPSDNVGASTKSNGSQVWGGSYITLTSPINFATQKKLKMKVWSPKVGMPVLLKVENLTSTGISKEVIVPTTTAGGWETLTFDFTTLDLTGGKTYQKVVFIFDNKTVGDGTTFYFDDIQQSN